MCLDLGVEGKSGANGNRILSFSYGIMLYMGNLIEFFFFRTILFSYLFIYFCKQLPLIQIASQAIVLHAEIRFACLIKKDFQRFTSMLI